MCGKLVLIWDYDGAIGRVNASYPYEFDENKILQEIKNVDTILELGEKFGIAMTFACTGIIAEEGHYPYHVPDQIIKIHSLGHEIASHSWKHEWLPYLEKEQILRSLKRSKYILEKIIGIEGSVTGFVPPFSRPMSWYSKGAFSLGDRVFGPWYPGGELGSLLRITGQTGYKWCRVSYRTILQKVMGTFSNRVDLTKPWQTYQGVVCVPMHYMGFDEKASRLLDEAVAQGGALVICGHPSGLSLNHEENLGHLEVFLKQVSLLQDLRKLVTVTVSQILALMNHG